MKKCNICLVEKEIIEFTKNKSMKDGLTYDCKGCRKIHKSKPEIYAKEKKYQRDYYRKKHKIPLDHPLRIYSGQGYVNKYGYRIITRKDHPNSYDKKGKISEHTFVMSEFLKRPLSKGETVHHRNGNRADNRIENLELWNSRHGPRQRVEDKVKWSIEFLNEYGYHVKKRD